MWSWCEREKGVLGDPRVFGFSSWKDRVVRSSVGGGWGRGGAGDDQVRGKLNRRLGGDASELMWVPLEGSWPSCARPGRVPRTEQRALLCESVVPHPLPGLPASSPHCQEPSALHQAARGGARGRLGFCRPQHGRAACSWLVCAAHGRPPGQSALPGLARAAPPSGLPSSPAVLPSPARPLG